MNMNHQIKTKQIILGLILLFIMSFFCVLVYYAQIKESQGDAVTCTLKPMHKANEIYQIELCAETPTLSETFQCSVPDLKKILIETAGEQLESDASLLITLTDTETGETYYSKKRDVTDLATIDEKKRFSIKLESPLSDSENKSLTLSIQLVNANNTRISITACQKNGIVTSFNGDSANHQNIIYSLKYAKLSILKPLYLCLCVALLLFFSLAYFLIAMRNLPVERFFLPLALCLGLIFQCFIPVFGVPDEPGHMNTAYKYSNMLLMIDDTDTVGTIYKRKCDVIAGDLLANDVESNSYYQMLSHTFESASDTELVEVAYTDSSNLMPGIIYIPTAIGLSIGRLFGCSAMLTYQLARIFNLLAFVSLASCAIRLIPFGKNLLAGLAMLPIALQQGASASYDAITNGAIFLFIALCFHLRSCAKRKKIKWVITLCLGLLIITIKGGAYSPLLLLLLLAYRRSEHRKSFSKKKIAGYITAICAAVAVILCLLIKILPTIRRLFSASQTNASGEELYSLSFIYQHPLNLLYVSWNTLTEIGSNHLRGMFGGILGWHNIKPSWLFVLIFILCLLLFTHVSNDRYMGSDKQRVGLLCLSLCSIGIIMMSMLFACTPVNANHIEGLQGRYYLPLCPLLLFTVSNSMVSVQENQCKKIWITYLMTELLMMLEVLPLVL